uniref:MATH domain-containing protein n=1 Tax=Strongyloides papillosus TaxID=174720 RepID=A0A0N5BN43_STREA
MFSLTIELKLAGTGAGFQTNRSYKSISDRNFLFKATVRISSEDTDFKLKSGALSQTFPGISSVINTGK